MKISWNWLLELCDLPTIPTPAAASDLFTRIGLEVERVQDLAAGFTGVLVAEVVAIAPHPQADKLRLVDVKVAASGPATTVVCGAPNVPPPGHRVLWAAPGARLPGPGGTSYEIAPKAIKGVVSPGMLCSEVELGLGDDDSGIVVFAPDEAVDLGGPAAVALGVNDWLFELSVPANRPDLLGHIGIAREFAAAAGGRLVLPATEVGALPPRLAALAARGPLPPSGSLCTVENRDNVTCGRYTARMLSGVRVAPSPRKLAARLRVVGVRPISNLVDITNYVMFETGQPLHAFDAAKISGGGIIVRKATTGETLETLDGASRALVPADVVIADARGALALAGVMGGKASEVTSQTEQAVLESASFAAGAVRKTGRRLGLNSEAAFPV